MARSIRSKELETRTARLKLPVSGVPVFVKIGKGIAIGYRRNRTGGAWVARLADGKSGNVRRNIGVADDYQDADGERVLDYWQASDAARRLATGHTGPTVATVADAVAAYEADLKTRGKSAGNVTRIRKHLAGGLADKPLALVTTREWRRWRDALATKIAPASVNRTCRALRAALNAAADQDRNLDRHSWRTGLSAIPDAETSRNVILDQTSIKAIVAAARDESAEFALLVEVAAQTGARPSQLRRLQVQDLIEGPDGARLSVPVSRKGRGVKAVTHRPVPISGGLAARLKVAAARRAVTAPLLTRPSGLPWAHSDQKKPFRRIAASAGQDPRKVTLYALRHSSITRMLLAGVPMRVVADHHDTSAAMIERTYSALIGQHTDALVRGALFDTEADTGAVVVPLRQ